MTYITCRRSSGNSGNRIYRVKIPFDRIDQIAPAAREPFLIETEKAYGFRVNGVNIFVPKSQIEDFHYRFNDHEAHIEFECKEWLITEKSLEIFIDTSHEPGLFDELNDPDYSDQENEQRHGQ